MRGALPALGLAAIAGCASVTVGEVGADAPAAYLSADPRFNAGLPVVVALRKVDSVELSPFHSRARLAPGLHHLLVDCTVAESKSTARFQIEIDAESGAHYRLVADLAPGNQHCDEVRVEVE